LILVASLLIRPFPDWKSLLLGFTFGTLSGLIAAAYLLGLAIRDLNRLF
jgi:hypothetical protein